MKKARLIREEPLPRVDEFRRFVRVFLSRGVAWIVCKGKGEQASEILYAAQLQKTPIFFDDDFAARLAQRADVGSSLTEVFFEPFIKAMKALGQI